jgi:ferric-dicitrate binding protein FerR (iron transport regulator)
MIKKVFVFLTTGLIIYATTFSAPQNEVQESSQNDVKADSSLQDSNNAAYEEARQRQLQIDYLEAQRQLQESQLKHQQEEQRRQQTIIYLGFSLFILMLAIIIGLIRRNIKLRKFLKEKGHQLEELEKG